MAEKEADAAMSCLVVGDANADLAASVEFFPHEGDDTGISALGFQSGGTAANVAVALARLGQTSRLLARVGEDPAADVALRAAKHAGVDLSFVQRDPALATGLCFAVISPGGERTFFSYRGANVALELPELPEFDHVFRDVAFLHVSGHALLEGAQRQTALALIAEANGRGVPVSLDLCLPLIRLRASELMALAPRLFIIFANTQELSLLGASIGLSGNSITMIDETLSALLGAGAPLVVAKLGAAGSRMACADGRIDIAPMPVTAVDTTGAGDGFVAAFLFTTLRGGSAEVAARMGNIVGALVASRSGAAEASPFGDEVRRVVAERDSNGQLEAIFSK